MPKLTKRAVDALKPSGSQSFLWCSELPGFGVRITRSGVRAFVYQYRPSGQHSKRLTIGRYGELTVDQARKIALGHAVAVREGKTPGQRRPMSKTFVQVVDDYEVSHLARRSSRHRKETLRVLRSYFPKLNKREFRSITRGDLLQVVDSYIAADKTAMARSIYRAAHGLLSWAADRQLIDVNPLAGVTPPTNGSSRDRSLSDREIACLWPALDQLGHLFGPWAQLALLTGQRVNEVAGMRRSEIRGDVWTLPAQRSKNNIDNTIPLSQFALDIIAGIDADGDFMFTGTGTTPISGFSKAKNRLDRLVKLPHWTWHDLRRTFATGLAELDVAPHIIEACLGHVGGHRAGVAGIYNRASYATQKKQAFDLWGTHTHSLVHDQSPKVIRLG